MYVVNAGPPDTVSVLSTRCRGCHPKGLIVTSSSKIKQTIIIIPTTRVSTNITFIGQFRFSFELKRKKKKYLTILFQLVTFTKIYKMHKVWFNGRISP